MDGYPNVNCYLPNPVLKITILQPPKQQILEKFHRILNYMRSKWFLLEYKTLGYSRVIEKKTEDFSLEDMATAAACFCAP